MAWFSIVVLSLIAGFEAVRYLIAPPAAMTGHAVAAAACFLASLALLWRLKKISHRLLSLGLLLLCGIAGYLIACTLYLKAPEIEKPPLLAPAASSEPGHTGIIYFTHGEPRTYDRAFEAWKEAIHEMDETGVPFVPWPFRPFFFKKVRDEYFEVGGSFHNLIHERAMQRIEAEYRKRFDPNARCYIAFSDDEPHVDVAAAQAVRDGATRLILLNVWLTDSDHSETGRKELEALQPEKHGVKLCVTETLKNSRRLMHMIVERANRASAGVNKSEIGVLLVAHGQPESWDKLFKKQPEQENSFRQEVKKLLVGQGYAERNIRLAYMEFRQPDIKTAVKELEANKVKLLLVSPVNISAESIHSEHEIPSLVEKAGPAAGIQVVHLGAWNDDQQLIDELLDRLAACR